MLQQQTLTLLVTFRLLIIYSLILLRSQLIKTDWEHTLIIQMKTEEEFIKQNCEIIQ